MWYLILDQNISQLQAHCVMTKHQATLNLKNLILSQEVLCREIS